MPKQQEIGIRIQERGHRRIPRWVLGLWLMLGGAVMFFGALYSLMVRP